MTEPAGDSAAKVLVEIRGGGGYISLSRPRVLSAIDSDMKSLLVDALEQLEADESVRAIVLTGSDCGAFSTGSDLKGIARNFDGGVDISGMQARSADYFGAVIAARKPVITAIDGYAVAGCFDLALAGNIRPPTARTSHGLPDQRCVLLGESLSDHPCNNIS